MSNIKIDYKFSKYDYENEQLVWCIKRDGFQVNVYLVKNIEDYSVVAALEDWEANSRSYVLVPSYIIKVKDGATDKKMKVFEGELCYSKDLAERISKVCMNDILNLCMEEQKAHAEGMRQFEEYKRKKQAEEANAIKSAE